MPGSKCIDYLEDGKTKKPSKEELYDMVFDDIWNIMRKYYQLDWVDCPSEIADVIRSIVCKNQEKE